MAENRTHDLATGLRYRFALEVISKIGGNLPDEELTRASGPNDSVRRGIMYTQAREVAIEALGGQ